jgi:hypothetical protein
LNNPRRVDVPQPRGANSLAVGDSAVLRIQLNTSDNVLFQDRNGAASLGNYVTIRGFDIAGFGNIGIGLSNCTGSIVDGNFIGTDITGTQASGAHNQFRVQGVFMGVGASNNTIGGTTAAARNVISGIPDTAIFVGPFGEGGPLPANNVIEGNYIGTDASGTHAVPNVYGVQISGGNNNVIGGTEPSERNLISGNSQNGVSISEGGQSNGTVTVGSTGNLVEGNYIGTDATGTTTVGTDGKPLGNAVSGVAVTNPGVTGNLIGGTAVGAGNLIEGNGWYAAQFGNDPAGVILGFGSSGNFVQGNSIVHNVGNGVVFDYTSLGNSVGGVVSGASNEIAFNSRAGVYVGGAGEASPPQGVSVGNSIRGNSIHDNTGLGIDLGGSGVPILNDSLGHTGPNNLQDFPVVTSAVVSGSNVTVSGTLNTTVDTAPFSVDVYASPTADPTYYGQGQYYLGATSIASGSSSFSATFTTTSLPAALLAAPWYISTTATDAGGNTSEFSKDVNIPVASVTGPSDGVPGQPRTFTLSANASALDQPAGFTFAANWGDGSPTQTVQGLSGVKVDHVYTGTGTSTMSVTATDSDGGVSAAVSKTVTITTVEMETDVVDPTKTDLAVGGTLGNDTITISPADTTGLLLNINVNGTTTFNGVSTFQPTGHLLVYSQSGSDTILLTKSGSTYIKVPALLYGGGSGSKDNDTISAAGSAANNVLTGGAGKGNTLTGGTGRDLLIAGLAASTLNAGSGDDILIGGSTDYDPSSAAMTYDLKLQALYAIMNEWGRTDLGYTARVNDLLGPSAGGTSGGLNGSSYLNGTTVHDNQKQDILVGAAKKSSALDWFFANTISSNALIVDILKNQKTGEVVTQIS